MCKLTLITGLCVIIASLGLPGLAHGSPCDGRPNGDYPNPNDLRTYYSCVAGITYTRQCPSGLVYSPTKQVCDYPGQPTSTPTTAQTTSTPTSAITPNGIFCRGRANGNYPNPNDPQSYYSCVAGLTYTRPCPSGLVYSPSKQVCDYPGQPTSTPTTAQTTSTPTSAITPNGIFCRGRANGNYPNPNDPQSYYSCVAGLTYTRPCPSGLVYSPSKQVCDYPAETTPTATTTTPPTTTMPTTTTMATTTTMPTTTTTPTTISTAAATGSGHPCEGRTSGHFADPSDPKRFFKCVPKGFFILPCGAGLVFSDVTGACSFPK